MRTTPRCLANNRYVRVSTTRQQQTQTIEQQLIRLREQLATWPDWHLAEEYIYRDDGYSGAKLNRPSLDRLRDRAVLAAFDLVLMTAPDRLARHDVHQMLLINELAQRGCEVEFLERPMSQVRTISSCSRSGVPSPSTNAP